MANPTHYIGFLHNVKQLTDFHEGCVFNQVSPESTFTHTDIVTIATPKGRVTLQDRKLTVINNGVKSATSISELDLEKVLSDSFGIKL